MTRGTALITGGGSGIGRATARALAAEGWSVAVSGRREAPLRETVQSLGEQALVVPGDVCDPDDAQAMVERTVEKFGGLDLLVNNAAVYGLDRVTDTSEEEWRRHFEVNLHGPWRLARLAYPHLRDSSHASVVNVLSTLAHQAMQRGSAYCASKAALEILGRCLALEWAADGIRVNAVSPGIVNTPIHGADITESAAGAQPLGRVGQPEEVAQAIVFLASDRSAWTTGANLDVDGGIRIA